MAQTSKSVKLRSKQNKVTELKQQGNIAFQLLLKSQQGDLDVDLKELLAYQLTPVPYSLGTADGFLVKTDKSALFHILTKNIDSSDTPPEDDLLTVVDGNAAFHAMVQVPKTFRDICIKVLDMMPKTCDVFFSTDMYKNDSIKAMERQRRGTSDKIILSGEATKRPVDWAAFLSNDDNKSQFIKLLLQVWSSDNQATKFKGRKVIIVCEGKAYKLTSLDGVHTLRENMPDLDSNQEETDTRIVIYCKYGNDQGYKYITVRSPDTDVFFILTYYAKLIDTATVLFDTGKGNKRRLINITEFCSGMTPDYSAALLSLHAITGCDTVSAFKGRGKKKPLKALQNHPQFIETLAKLGEKWDVDKDFFDELQAFICVIYGRSQFRHVDNLRFYLLQEKCDREESVNANTNIDLSSFPPCSKSLKQHVKRANYQTAIWKRSHVPNADIPNASEGHGWHVSDGILQPLWTEEVEELTLPESVIDDLVRESERNEDDQSESEDIDYYDFDFGDQENDNEEW